MNRILTFLIFSFLIGSGAVTAQSLYDPGSIQQIEIHFSQPDWDYQMDTAKYGADGYLLADWVVVNGQQFDSAGVKYKGNSSYDSTYLKNPLHISLDAFRNQSYEGYSEIKLGNGYADPAVIREVLAYSILRNYMDGPQSNFAEVYINGNYIGLYSNDEHIGKKFCSDHFYSSGNTFVKCNPQIASAAFRSNLKYLSADSSAYQIRYEMQSETGWSDLVALCDSLSNNPASFTSVMDADRVIWMLAFNNVLVNLDSYSGAFAQNHYVYRDHTDHYNPVVWDLNMAFGGFPFAGSQGVGMGTLDTVGMQTMPISLHAAESDWPLIRNVMNDASLRKMYVAHLRTITEEIFASGAYLTEAARLQALIDTSVMNDPNAFFSYAEFQQGLTLDVLFGSHYVPGIQNLMSARLSYLQSTPEFAAVPPSISNVAVSDTAPDYLSTVAITAEVTNADVVYFGYRYSKYDKFIRIPMFDDGLHDDGAAGDGIFGITLSMDAASMQYYIYAENADAGMFSPVRAEHEYYSVAASLQTAQPGDIFINEFLAVNQNDTVDENGAHEDWIELYNPTSGPLSLFGLYLTDTYSNLTKFAFPQDALIPANGYFMIWADEDNTTSGELHCNFKLSSNGESLVLSNAGAAILDSITYGAQTVDHSMARCPNGTGPFTVVNSPSFKEANHCTDDIPEQEAGRLFTVFPNPAYDKIRVLSTNASHPIHSVQIYDVPGRLVASELISSGNAELDVSGLKPGLYLLRVTSTHGTAFLRLVVAR